MNGSPVITKLTTFASSSSTVMRQALNPVWKILSISAADDAVYPANVVSASIDKGALSVVYGARVLSQIKVKGIREYSFEEDRYPQPEVFASSLALAINDLAGKKASYSREHISYIHQASIFQIGLQEVSHRDNFRIQR